MSQALSETIRTIRVGITGTSSAASYTLAPGLAQYVESVYIEVNNGAASGVHPVLTIAEQAGVVIAKRRQGGTIAAGNTGSATWALRLSGDDSGDTGLTGIFYDTANSGDWLEVATTGSQAYAPAQGSAAGNTFGQVFDAGYSADAILLQARDLFVELFNNLFVESNGGSMSFLSPGGFTIDSSASALLIKSGAGALTLNSQGGGLTLDDEGGGVTLNATGALDVTTAGTAVNIRIGSGTSLTITGTSGQPIFRANSAGDLHGQTGKTLTFDL